MFLHLIDNEVLTRVYLKNVTIQGFKSFPDKISVNFIDGLTAIVGPNGSGKSNICDAIRWVLGEQSTKTLRGAKMEDIIFNGTARRSATGYAEVTLLLNNQSNIIKSDYDEISVTRRYYRSGDSEYYINKNQVRLKDIHELFMDTGLGRDGYSIIGQGRIAEIISLKSEDRRQVFEEAAGITKFRYRKNESERKLLQADENLARVEDIILQLEERVGPLKVASEKASKFLLLRDKLRDGEINLWLRQLDELREKEKESKEKLTIAKSTLELNGKDCDNLDAKIEKGYEDLKKCDIAIDHEKNISFENENIITKNKGEIALLQNNISNHRDNIKRLELEIEYAKISAVEVVDKIELHTASLTHNKKELDDLKQKLEAQMNQDDVLTTFLTTKNEEIAVVTAGLKKDMADRADARITVSAKNAQILTGRERLQMIGKDGESKAAELAAIEKRVEQEEKELTKLEEAYKTLENAIVGREKMVQLKSDEMKQLQDEYHQKDRALYDSNSRYKMLKDMEREFDGYGKSVKMVMKESLHGRLRGVFGPVSGLIGTKEDYVTAIETALGGGAQNIVVENEGCAKEAIYLLKSQNGGRATFLPITAVKGKDFSWNGVEQYKGYIGIGSDLVTYDAKYEGIVKSMLARTVIVTDMDCGIAIAKAYRYAFRIVTLDGQVLNPGGSMTGGSMNKSSGVFSRGAEVQRLEGQIATQTTAVQQLKKQGESARTILEQTKFELQKAVGQREELGNAKMKLGYEVKNLMSSQELLKLSTASLQQEQTEIKAKIEQLLKESKILEDSIAGLDEKISKSEAKTTEIEQNRVQFIQDREEINAVIFDLKIKINTQEKDMEVLEDTLASLAEQKITTKEGEIIKREEITLKQKAMEEFEQQIIVLKEENEAMTHKIEQCTARIVSTSTMRMETEKTIGDRQKELKECRSRLASLEREYVRLENMVESTGSGQDTIINKMWESYEIALSEAQGYKKPIESMEQVGKEVSEMKSKIKALGNINIDAIEEYREVSQKYEFLTAQRDDLNCAKEGLHDVISDLTKNMRKVFKEQFSIINTQFQKTFVELFGGGSGELVLDDPENVLDCGIEIRVQPPGKKVKSLSLLSGGEQAFVAIALVFAILKVRPTPFCVFDEIEAALDDVNVKRYADYIKGSDGQTQFIVVTHRRGTMEAADMLYGVTMQEQGVSKLLAIHVSEIEEKLKMKAN